MARTAVKHKTVGVKIGAHCAAVLVLNIHSSQYKCGMKVKADAMKQTWILI